MLILLINSEINTTDAAEAKKPIPMTEQDIDYILKSTDTQNKTLEPAKPESEAQALLSEAWKELKALDVRYNAEIAPDISLSCLFSVLSSL